MQKNTILFFTVLSIILVVGKIRADVTLTLDSEKFFSGTTGIVIECSLENPYEVSSVQADILFDTDCISVTGVEKTDRSGQMDIFHYSDIDSGIRIAMTGIAHSIAPGTGSVATITMDVGECDDGDYVFDVTGCMVADPFGGEIACHEIDNSIIYDRDGCVLEIPQTAFNFGDVRMGESRTATLMVTNVGIFPDTVNIVANGCARVEQNTFPLNVGSSQNISVICRPEEEGPCEGTLSISCDGSEEYNVLVTCNGVILPGTKGDVNEDGLINILDAIAAVYYMLGLIELTGPEAIWAADCNGPYFHCDGDGTVDISDIMKIVNLILQFDECLSLESVYTNSFESEEDVSDWYFREFYECIDDPAPGAGAKSLHIHGGCVQPTAYFDLPQQPEEDHYTLSLWGKAEEIGSGSVVLTTEQLSGQFPETIVTVSAREWQWSGSNKIFFCPKEHRLRIEIWHGGYMFPGGMFIDNLKVERVK